VPAVNGLQHKATGVVPLKKKQTFNGGINRLGTEDEPRLTAQIRRCKTEMNDMKTSYQGVMRAKRPGNPNGSL